MSEILLAGVYLGRMLRPHKSVQKVAIFDSNAITFVLFGLVLTLLIIQLGIAPPFHSYNAGLPLVAHPIAMYRADRNNALRVTVTRDGRFYLGSDEMDEIRAVAQLKARLRMGAEPELYIEADRRARYSSVSKVLDAAAAAGIYQIAFLVEQSKNVSR